MTIQRQEETYLITDVNDKFNANGQYVITRDPNIHRINLNITPIDSEEDNPGLFVFVELTLDVKKEHWTLETPNTLRGDIISYVTSIVDQVIANFNIFNEQ